MFVSYRWRLLLLFLVVLHSQISFAADKKTSDENGNKGESGNSAIANAEEGHSTSSAEGDHTTSNHSCGPHQPETVHLASLRWEEIGIYFSITAFVVVAGFAKLGFHKLTWLSNKVPESCLLVILGLVVGLILYFATDREPHPEDPCYQSAEFPTFSTDTFFLILLPPIILDSAYSLHDRVFLDNLGSVIVFAVIGTLFNVFAIGGALYGVHAGGLVPGMDLSLSDCFVFSSLISAVDPVAVLAIFQELSVNQNLYFLVFGESLLNDGVTVVLYNTMKVFNRLPTVTAGQVLLAILAFFIASFGGIFIGILYGILTALVTKFTHSVRVLEPLAMLALAYLSYLTAELFHFSGIISLIVCGLLQAHYGFYNISQKSYICVKYFTKMASATSDTIIFMFLGMVLVNDNHEWNTGFVLWTLIYCLIFRFLGVFTLAAIMNRFRNKPFDLEEQFIAAYGGLRGAIAFSLASTLDEDMEERNTFIFTTLIVILFTVFVQGITIRPLVQLLNIQRHKKAKKSLNQEIAETSIDHMMAGVEEILGHHGDFYIKELLTHYNEKYFKKYLLQDCADTKLTRLFEKIALSEHYAHLYGPVTMVEDNVTPLVGYDPLKKNGKTPISPLMHDEVLNRSSIISKGSDFHGSKDHHMSLIDVEEPTVPLRRKMSLAKSLSKRKTISSVASTGEEKKKEENHALLQAFKDNRYNKLHYTYNRNLVGDDDQEMINHLNRRSFNAQRMSSIVTRNSGDMDNNPSKTVSFAGMAAAAVLIRRHRRRTLLAQEGRAFSATPSAGSGHDGPQWPNSFKSAEDSPSTPAKLHPMSAPIFEETEETTDGRGDTAPPSQEWQPEVIPLLKMPPSRKGSKEEGPPPTPPPV